MTYKDFAEQVFLPKSSTNYKKPNDYTHCVLSYFNNHIFPYFGDIEIESVRPIHTEAVVNAMCSNGPSFFSVEINNMMKRTFRYAIELDIIHRNPCISHFTYEPIKKYTYPDDLETHKLIIDSIDKLALRDIFGFCYTTGFSISEITRLHRSDYDSDSHLLTINSYAHKGRYKVPDCALKYLEPELKKTDSLPHIENGLLFSSESGTHIVGTRIDQASHILKYYLNKPNFTSNNLRYAYGNMLRLTGADDWI